MAATIQDVAKKSGVGVGTVSRVLNGGTNVRKETCDKVLEAIKELNYIPNSLGVKLRTNRNKVFALLVPVINHTFFSELAAHIEKEAEKYGYSILLVCSQHNVEKENDILDKLNRNEVDGIIFVTHFDHSVEQLKNKNIVTIDRHLPGDIPFVASDNYDSSKEAVEYLIKKGCKNIAFLGSRPHVDSEVLLREKAYLDVIKKYGMEPKILNDVIKHGEEKDMIKNFIEMYPDVDGIFVSGAPMSYLLYSELINQGKKIPEDVQIVSYDGFFNVFKDNNIITCVEQQVEEMAKKCIEILIDLINKKKIVQQNIVKSKFLINKTTK